MILTERHISGAGTMMIIYVLNLVRSEDFIDHREVIVSE